jgi:NitT/TauT family transport system substrate-binding protein
MWCTLNVARAAIARIGSALVRLAVLWLVAWAGPALADAPVALTIATSRTPLSLPLYVAQAEGYFAAAGLKVTLLDCIGGHRCLKLVIDGQAQLATAADLPIVLRSMEQDDLAVLATIATTQNDLKLIARKSAGITDPRKLVGKKVGVVMRTASHYFLSTFLLSHGVDPRDVEFVPLQPEQLVDALVQRQVDAVSSWEPYGYLANRQLALDSTVLPNGGVYLQSFNLVGRRTELARDPRSQQALLQALQRANRLIASDPARAQALMHSRLEIDAGFTEWAWRSFRFRLSLDQALLSTLESEARWALREAVVARPSTVNFFGLLYSDPLRALDAGAVGVAR